MSQLGPILQESLRREREARTILGFLREQMDGPDAVRGRRTLKERLGLKGMTCCGVAWGFRTTTISVRDNDDEDEDVFIEQQNQEPEAIIAIQIPSNNNPRPDCTAPVSSGSGMNLAAALAAERQIQTTNETTVVGSRSSTVSNNESGTGTGRTALGTPSRVSLMRLLEETDCGDMTANEGGGGVVGGDSVCCVCMGRKKGAAFIPCGHTFCRLCSREVWLNRGSCPLCNRLILEILDIY